MGGQCLGHQRTKSLWLCPPRKPSTLCKHTTKEAIWLRCLLTEIFKSIDMPTTLFSNSKSAITLANNGHYHACTKHIDIRYHSIRYIIEAGTTKLVYCPTNDMTADTLTKALPSVKVKHFTMALGLTMVWGGVLEIRWLIYWGYANCSPGYISYSNFIPSLSAPLFIYLCAS